MGDFKKFKFFISALALFVVLTFAGTVSGTISWFAYTTRATVSYSGTSVSQSALIQVGLVCNFDYWAGSTPAETEANHEAMKDTYDLTYEYVDSNHIYFSKPGAGINSVAIKEYLSKTGYAINQLEPVTSRFYETDIEDENVGNDLTLYKAPMKERALNETIAEKPQYSKIKLAFRILTSSSATPIYAQNQNIWLTKITPKMNGDGNVVNALRIHFDGSTSSGKKFILNPTTTDNGGTAVAGLLNISGDDDYYDSVNGDEIVYGDYEGSLDRTYNALPSEFVDINKTGDTGSESTTFYARHEGSTRIYDYDADDFAAGIRPKVAQYIGTNSLFPSDSNGQLSGGIPLCKTKMSATNAARIAYLDLSIWLEGWDHAVTDEEIGHAFFLALQFQINKPA